MKRHRQQQQQAAAQRIWNRPTATAATGGASTIADQPVRRLADDELPAAEQHHVQLLERAQLLSRTTGHRARFAVTTSSTSASTPGIMKDRLSSRGLFRTRMALDWAAPRELPAGRASHQLLRVAAEQAGRVARAPPSSNSRRCRRDHLIVAGACRIEAAP